MVGRFAPLCEVADLPSTVELPVTNQLWIPACSRLTLLERIVRGEAIIQQLGSSQSPKGPTYACRNFS